MPASPLQERTNSPFSPPTALPPSAFSRNNNNAPPASTTTPKPFRLPLLNAPSLPPSATASRRSSSHSFPRPLPPTSSSTSLPSLSFTSSTSTSTSSMDGSSFSFCVDPRSGRAMVSPVKPRPAGGAERGGGGGTVSHGGGGVPPSAVLWKGTVEVVESPFGKSAPVAASWTGRRASGVIGVEGGKRILSGGAFVSNGMEEDLRFDLDAEPSKRFLPFYSAPTLATGSSSSADPFDPFLSIATTTTTSLSQATENPPSTDGPNADHEEDLEGRSLLSQWTTVSPSPKREQGRKRARTATLSGAEEAQAVVAERGKGRPHSNTISLPVKGFQLPPIPALPPNAAPSPFIADLPPLPSSASSLAFPPSDVPSSPSRPLPPRRHPSLGTALSSLSLVTEEEPAPSAEEATPPSLPLTATSSSVSTASTVVEKDSNPLAAALASLLSKDKIHLLPAGLVPLLEVVVTEGAAHLAGDTSSSNEGNSRLAVLAGLVEGKKGAEEEDDPMREEKLENNDFSTQGDVVQPPPSHVSARLQPHVRSASSCSSLSLSSTSAVSTFSSLSLRSHRSTPSFSSTSTTPVPPTPSHHASSFSSLPSSLPVPYNPHPPYPANFARPLRFIYETGAATYEEQRAERTSFLASSSAAAAEQEEDEEEEWKEGGGRGKRRRGSGVAAGEGGGQGKGEGRGGKKRKGLTRGRSVGWADEEEVEESGGKGGQGGKGKEEEEDCLYVPRPSRSRAGKLVDEEEDAAVPSPRVEEPVEGQEKGRKKGGKRERWGRG